MKIDVQRVGEEPDELHLKLEPGWFAAELEGVYHTDGEGQGEARLLVSKAGTKLQVTGQLTASFPVSCGRCLEAALISVDEPFVMFFEESSEQPQVADDNLELTAEDLHWATFSGPEVNLAPFLRDQLLLAVPMTPLCHPGCEGLLKHVQRPDPEDDEEAEQLELDGKAINPRWNALAKLKPTR